MTATFAFLDWLADGADKFIGLFQRGGEQFVSLFTGIVPTLLVLLVAVNSLIRMVGTERINRFARFASRDGLAYLPLRYLLLPIVSVFFLTNPMAYTMGRFLPERYKPAFYDSAVSFVHPILGLFPHANAGELFVYAGIAAGITKLDLTTGDLAARYFLVGMVVILIRGIVTEIISARMFARGTSETTAAATATGA